MSSSSIFTQLRRPRAVWLTLAIAWLGALAPTVSHALAAAREGATPGFDVCTSNGPRLPAQSQRAPATLVFSNTANETDSPDGQKSVPDLTHCPLCLLSTDRDVPTPHSLVHLFVVLGNHEEPTIGQAFFFRSLQPLVPAARGPPAFS